MALALHVHIVSERSISPEHPRSAADAHLFFWLHATPPGFSVMVRLTRARQRVLGGA
jgi:hypothetical protein